MKNEKHVEYHSWDLVPPSNIRPSEQFFVLFCFKQFEESLERGFGYPSCSIAFWERNEKIGCKL